MSAKLMKMVAQKSVVVRNTRSGEVRVYWDGPKGRKHVDIGGHATMDLLAVIPLEALRRNRQVAELLHAGHLVEA